MDVNFLQYLLVFLVTFIAGIDQFSLLESLYQPIVMGPVVGAILGHADIGLVVGGTYQLMTIGNMPVGGAQPPNAVIGGIMATILAIFTTPEGGTPDATAAVGMAIPFALLGQYAVIIMFTITSPLMAKADAYAAEANPDGIVRLNILTMCGLGTLFGLVSLLGLWGGAQFGQTIQEFTDKNAWIASALSAAGGMMRYVGFAILLKVMISTESWGFYFAGFALATIMAAAGLGGQTLVLIAMIGFAIAYWDYQIQTKFKSVSGGVMGGDEDGI